MVDKLVSFIVPVYKTEPYLEKCIKSLIDQDYPNVEIVIVADGKSPGAEKIVNKINSQRIVKYITIPHGGAPRARNEGFKYTKGDYVSFWDSDCYAEPGMARVWVKAFTLYPEVSFVYSGYRFNDENLSYYESEPFNAYSLTCNNYVATMFPMKRELFPGFDESLKSLQDWDLWLRIVKAGGIGFYLEGSGFTTELDRKGISAIGCSAENWLDRYETIRTKNGITGRDVCFFSINHKDRAIELAELTGQDYSRMPSFHPHRYKVLYAIGFYANTMDSITQGFRNASPDCKRVIHWMGKDVESIQQLPWKSVRELVKSINQPGIVNYAENEVTYDLLQELGIKSELFSLPMDVVKVVKPKEFKVFYEGDESTLPLLFSISKALPHFKIESPDNANLKDYACYLSLTYSKCPNENIKRFLASGRPVITNYQLPYAGYLSDENDLAKYKNKLIGQINLLAKRWKRGLGVKSEAIRYYQDMLNPQPFKDMLIKIKEVGSVS